MPSTTVVKPTTYDAYECDGPTCREKCESYTGTACGWVQVPMPHDERERRWFCSWACLAEYACWREERLPLQTRRAPWHQGLPF
jgi:hypothetical protein